MSLQHFTDRFTEPQTHSIFNRFRKPRDFDGIRELLAEAEVALSLKYTAILASFAYLDFPLEFAAFRALVPEEFWAEHVRCYYNGYRGNVPIYCEPDEIDYSLHLGPRQSPYDIHYVYFTVKKALLPQDAPSEGYFEPPLDASIGRFTLGAPGLRAEMHDPTGLYLFK